jgi:putative ABC transport system permease protein
MSGKHEAARGRPYRPAADSTPETTRSRARVAAGWRRLTGSASATAVGFCLLACACAVVAVAGPRASAQVRTNAFRQLAAATPAIDKTVVGTLDANSLGAALSQGTALTELVGQTQLHLAEGDLRHNLAAAMPLAGPGSDWSGLTTPYSGFIDHSSAVGTDNTQLELAYRDNLSKNVRVLAGSLPSGAPVPGPAVTVQMAITAATAKRFNLGVGSRVTLPDTGITLTVTGIVAPVAPGGPFWGIDRILAAPVVVMPQLGEPYWQGGAFVPAGALAALESRFNPSDIQLTWVFGAAIDHLTAAQAVSLAQSVPGALATAGQLFFRAAHNLATANLTTGVSSLLGEFAAQNSAVGNVLDLMSVSLAVVGAAVVLLAAWLMAEKRREEFAVLRARGASRRQLATAALLGSAIAALPGAAIGIAAAVRLTPGAGSPLAWWLAGLTILAALAGPALITIRLHRGYAGMTRPDRSPGRLASMRRLIVECGLVLGSVGGLIVLRDQGVGPTGADLYASAAPILMAVPVAIVLLRLYPVLVRPLLGLASRRSGVTAFLGLARAARVSATAVLPAFAMVLALTLVSFAGMVRGAVIRGEVGEAWQQAGAEAVISVPGAISAAQQRAIAAVPGVTRTALTSVTTATQGFSGPSLAVLVADPAGYAALLAATPLRKAPSSFRGWHPSPVAEPAGTVAVLASDGLARQLGHGAVGLILQGGVREQIHVVGIAPGLTAVLGVGGQTLDGYVVLPRSALNAGGQAALSSSMLLVAGAGLDDRALTAAVARLRLRGAHVTLRSQLLTALEQAPLQHGSYALLALGGDAAAVGCLLVLLLTLMLSAQSRQMTLARAATMGLSTAQGRWLTLVEALPQILSVLIGGLICALALVPLVGPTLGLAVFTGSTAAVPVRIEPLWLTATAIGLLVLAMATLTGQTVLASRQAPRSLRMGG